jgi:hypothetical protein
MAGAASALFLLDIKGRVLVWRDYRGDVTAAQAERFFTKLIETESNDPVAYDNGVTYMFVQHSNIYLMIASRQNCNAASLLFFLHRVVDVSIPSDSVFCISICFLNLKKKERHCFICYSLILIVGLQALLRGVRGRIFER